MSDKNRFFLTPRGGDLALISINGKVVTFSVPGYYYFDPMTGRVDYEDLDDQEAPTPCSSCPKKDQCEQTKASCPTGKRVKIPENETRDTCCVCSGPTKKTYIDRKEIRYCPKCE